jgi:NAD(P)-dependent dehydrogenase (short-subunit alcohol dehydrogenase family)
MIQTIDMVVTDRKRCDFVQPRKKRKVGLIMSKLTGKVAVITGGGTGIGLAIARRFVSEGAHVFVVGRRQAELDKAKALMGEDLTTVQGDVTSFDDLDRLVDTVRAEKGVVDVIVTNAGLVEQAPIDTATPEHFDRTFNLNARAMFFTVQKLLPLMTHGSSIVLVSSAMHSLGIPGHSAYAATKAAVRSFSRTWAAELKDRGIRVNTLSPGVTETPMLSGQGSEEENAALRRMYISMTPMGRICRPEETAAAALFLASDESSFSTGTDLVVDGGIVEL